MREYNKNNLKYIFVITMLVLSITNFRKAYYLTKHRIKPYSDKKIRLILYKENYQKDFFKLSPRNNFIKSGLFATGFFIIYKK